MTAELDIATLHEALAAEFGDEPCVIAAGRSWSWREVTDRTRRLAAVLRAHGLGARLASAAGPAWETGQDHLGILLHNSAEYLEALLGAHKASVAPFNINYRYTADELTYLLRDAHPQALVYGASFAPLVAAALPSLDSVPLLLQVADGSETALLPGALDYEEALAAAEPRVFAPSADDRQLMYTGGTTGMPKGVVWRSGDLVAGPFGVRGKDGKPLPSLDDAVRRARKIRGRVLPAPPLMHGAGLAVAVGGWLGGGTVVIQPRPEKLDPAVLLDTCERERVTSIVIVGDAFGGPIVAELERHARDLPDLRVIVNAGAALRPELKDRLGELLPGARVTDLVASSEGVVVRKDKGDGNRLDARGGIAVLAEDRSRLLNPGEDAVGWLAKSGGIPLGYLGDPEKTAQTFVSVGGQRFSVPGDRARIGEDGGIEFLGRDATTINTGGEKVFADEVEQVVRALPGVLDAVVVGRPSERWGNEVVALVQPGAGLAAAELGGLCRESLAGYKVPKEFILVDEVRRHANGKPDYKWARAAASTA